MYYIIFTTIVLKCFLYIYIECIARYYKFIKFIWRLMELYFLLRQFHDRSYHFALGYMTHSFYSVWIFRLQRSDVGNHTLWKSKWRLLLRLSFSTSLTSQISSNFLLKLNDFIETSHPDSDLDSESDSKQSFFWISTPFFFAFPFYKLKAKFHLLPLKHRFWRQHKIYILKSLKKLHLLQSFSFKVQKIAYAIF